MKKFLLTALCGFGLVAGIANAGDDMMGKHHKMDPVCKEAMNHMRDSRPAIDAAIKENNAQKVGELVIADHKYIEDFFTKHPQCKPKHDKMGHPNPQPAE